MLVETLHVLAKADAGTDTFARLARPRPITDSELILQVPAPALRPATKADALDTSMAAGSSAAALPPKTPHAPIRCITGSCHRGGF